ncbi:hypothetical protein Tsubulata_019495 [Turnera subulata]|uniref:NADP-dependent oxidoreductase domain-containing protein n=1 Tax=Turnera subulata TaxID=218843 RepID=A0A9Q0F2H9_9ROSI|nr:hypothetical protein Tsubulata_019495 [Turnera subulata]
MSHLIRLAWVCVGGCWCGEWLTLGSGRSMISGWLGSKFATEAMILPLDLASGEFALKEAVDKADSCFNDAGVDYMIQNAAYERPVSEQQYE